jgi:hypothetical protein
MHPQNGGRPPPRDAGDDLPVEQLPGELDAENMGVRGSLQAALTPHERLAYLARKIHRLGERPLYELFVELGAGAPLHERLERYARLEADYGNFIRTMGGDRLPRPRLIARRRA